MPGPGSSRNRAARRARRPPFALHTWAMDGDEARPAGPEPVRAISKGLTEYAVLLSIGLVALSVVHIWAFAGYNSATSLAILTVVDRTAILLATAIVFVPLVLVQVIFQALLYPLNLWRRTTGSVLARSLLPFTLLLLGFVFFANVAAIFLLFLLPTAAYAAWARRRTGKGSGTAADDEKRTEGRLRSALLVGVVVPIAYVTLTLPWSPREELRTEVTTYTGYVIGANEGRHLVVLSDQKEAVWVAVEDVTARRLCSSSIPWWLDDLSRLFFGQAYDECSSDSRRDTPPAQK